MARVAQLDRGALQVLRRQAPALMAEAKRKATRADLERILAPLVVVFGVTDAATTPTFWRAYEAVLAEHHPEALEAAAGKWLQTGKFFPKPAELRELARAQPLRCVFLASHARAALKVAA